MSRQSIRGEEVQNEPGAFAPGGGRPASLRRIMSRPRPLRARSCAIALLIAGAVVGPLVPSLAVAQAPAAEAGEPADPERVAAARRVIRELNETLLTIMKRADELGYSGRYALVEPVVARSFDLLFMSKKTVGRHWKKLADDDKRRWIDTFTGFTISNFADRFDGYSGQSFELSGEKPARGETVIILTRLVRPNSDDVELNYRMREVKGEWKVVDIYSGGKVSEVALRRSEYARVLKRGGIDALIEVVSAKSARRAGEG